jgi:hypothetical protein
MRGFHSCCAALTVLLFAACEGNKTYIPDSAGGQGEVLVVMSNGHWEGEPGAAVRSIFEQAINGLPQREARFKLAQTTPENFGTLLAVHHSVLLAVIDGSADSVGVLRQRDKYAKGQLLVQLSAKDPVTWIGLLQREGYAAADLLEEHQRTRVGMRLARERDAALVSSLKAQFDITLDIPGGYRVMKQTPHFSWLQRDRIITGSGMDHNVIEGVLIHVHPYSSDSTFTVPFLVDQRDSVTTAFVEGPSPGSYMVVQRAFETTDLMPTSRSVTVDGRFGFLMHGLYGMHGAKMGGPFVSLSTVDEERARLITVEGFVYAPQFDKREYVRELEALLFSLRLAPVASP